VPKNVPKTIDSMREKDDTMLVDMDEEDQLELNLEIERDELSSYFQKTYEPKVLITFSDNPHEVSFIFVFS
jgi:ribosome production factor 1